MELNLLNLLLVLLAAWCAGLITNRLGYPSVLGELLVGIVLGPPLLGLLQGGEALAVIAEIGVLLMMLYIGMEIDPAELGRASKGGILAAFGGFITPFVLCYLLVVYGAGQPPIAGVFVGLAAGVTSLATKSRVLVDLHLLDTRIAHVMMAGALVADTVALIIFAVVVSITNGQSGGLELLLIGGRVVVFFVLATFVGLKVLPSVMRHLVDKVAPSGAALFMVLMLVMILYAAAGRLAGMHGILGAFLAGLFLRETVLGRTLSQELMHRVRDVSLGFLAPVFFVTAGFAVSLDVFRTDLTLLLGLVGFATLGKIVGTAIFYLPTGYGWREGVVLGLGMNGRGAVEIIIAQLALSMGLINAEIFSLLVFMAISTTAIEPVLLKWGVGWLQRRGELARSDEERQGILIIGAGSAARRLATILSDISSSSVTVIDANPQNVRLASQGGLHAVYGNALDERVMAEAAAAQMRHLVTITPNGEVNALAAQLGRSVFAIPEIHVLRATSDVTAHAALLEHLHATTLFGGPVALGEWAYFARQDRMEIQTFDLAVSERPTTLFERLRRDGALPVAVRRGEEAIPFHDGLDLLPGDRIVYMHSRLAMESPTDGFNGLIRQAVILDLEGPIGVADFVKHAARILAPSVGLTPAGFMEQMLSREAESSTVILPGIAIPHLKVTGRGVFALLVGRCREGISFPGSEEAVVAAFTLVTSADQRHMHLRALAAIAQLAQQPNFETRWLQAENIEALREIMLRPDRPGDPAHLKKAVQPH